MKKVGYQSVDWEHLPSVKRLKEASGLVQPAEETVSGRLNSSVLVPTGNRRWNQAFHSGAQWEDKKQQA